MLGEFPSKRGASTREGIHSIVNGNLAILVIEEKVDVFATLSEDFLAKHDRGSGCIDEEVIIGDFGMRWQSCPTIIAQVKDTSLDAQPGSFSDTSSASKCRVIRTMPSNERWKPKYVYTRVIIMGVDPMERNRNSRLASSWRSHQDYSNSTRMK